MGTEQFLGQKAHRHDKAPASYHFRYLFESFVDRASAQEVQRMIEVFLRGPENVREKFLRDAELAVRNKGLVQPVDAE